MIDPKDASYIEDLETQIAKLRAEIDNKDVEIKRLKKEKGLSSAREGLTFNDRTGIWTDKEGKHFCPTCLNDEKRNPLKTEERGWRCTAAGHYFGNPDAPRPVVRGGGSWMSS